MSHEWTFSAIAFYLSLGLAAGVFSVLFGVGSGIIVIPMLTLLAGYAQKDAQGMALALMVPMALMGAWRYQINPEIHIDWKWMPLLVVAVIIGVNLGAMVVGRVSNRSLQMGFAVILFVTGGKMLWDAWRA